MNILATIEQVGVYKAVTVKLKVILAAAKNECRNFNLAGFCIPGKVPVRVEVLSNRFRNLQGAAALNISDWCSFVFLTKSIIFFFLEHFSTRRTSRGSWGPLWSVFPQQPKACSPGWSQSSLIFFQCGQGADVLVNLWFPVAISGCRLLFKEQDLLVIVGPTIHQCIWPIRTVQQCSHVPTLFIVHSTVTQWWL